MGNWLYFIVIAAGTYCLFVTVMVVLSVRKMRHPQGLLEEVRDPERLDDPQGITAWARAQGFELDSQFDFSGIIGAGDIKMAVEGWFLPSKKLFLMHYHVLDKFYYEFVTGLEGDYSLTSSKSVDSLNLPFPPKMFVQVFEDDSLDELLEKHEKTLAFFKERFGVAPIVPTLPLQEMILHSIETQMAYVQSLPFWYLRGLWWHLIRRRQLRNKSVIEQIHRLDGE